VSTAELDEVAAGVMRAHGARSAPMLTYRFPGHTCISVNNEAVHGIPSSRRLLTGDLVKLDVTVEVDGYMSDAAETVLVPPVSEEAASLAQCARRAFVRGIEQARAGRRVWEIGRAVEDEVRASGYSVIRELSGHGIGRTIHEAPMVPNYHDRSAAQKLTEGLVITVEPIIARGSGACLSDRNGWMISTRDGSLSAHHEHTMVITQGEPILLTE
jgi:methionyl aminopeptidase